MPARSPSASLSPPGVVAVSVSSPSPKSGPSSPTEGARSRDMRRTVDDSSPDADEPDETRPWRCVLVARCEEAEACVRCLGDEAFELNDESEGEEDEVDVVPTVAMPASAGGLPGRALESAVPSSTEGSGVTSE